MAVQQNRKTRSKRGMRRSHDALKPRQLSLCPTCLRDRRQAVAKLDRGAIGERLEPVDTKGAEPHGSAKGLRLTRTTSCEVSSAPRSAACVISRK
jgi:ribosomal protein L32